MKTKSLYFIFLLMYFNAPMIFSLCPDDFEEVSPGVCQIGFTAVVQFCQANEMCQSEGLKRDLRLYLPGVNAALIPSKYLSENYIFTSITALLNRTVVLVDGWQFGDPGYSGLFIDKSIQKLHWGKDNPNHPTQAITIYRNGDFIDIPQVSFLGSFVVCELSNLSVPGPDEPFRRDWPFALQSLFIPAADAVGCFSKQTSDSLLICAKE